MNSNTFQDQPDQELSYKFGSMQHVDKAVRKQAVDHNIEVIKYGLELGSESLTVWLSDGSCFPGQLNFRKAFQNTLDSLQEVYTALPDDWKMFVEYKAFEPNFYSTTGWRLGDNHYCMQVSLVTKPIHWLTWVTIYPMQTLNRSLLCC
jgi:L-rhamnose isomerase/sugar isomerase